MKIQLKAANFIDYKHFPGVPPPALDFLHPVLEDAVLPVCDHVGLMGFSPIVLTDGFWPSALVLWGNAFPWRRLTVSKCI